VESGWGRIGPYCLAVGSEPKASLDEPATTRHFAFTGTARRAEGVTPFCVSSDESIQGFW
jgi:hypothetical protein